MPSPVPQTAGTPAQPAMSGMGMPVIGEVCRPSAADPAQLPDLADAVPRREASSNSKRPAVPGTFPGAACFVWAVWAVLMAANLNLIYQYHSCVPFEEDWGTFVPVLVGEQPITWNWLWAQEFEHRPVLMRLFGAVLLKWTGGDYWLLMLFLTVPLGVLALALVWISRRLWGRIQYAHALLPIALMHWYMGGIYLCAGCSMGYQLATLGAIVMLLIILRWGALLTPRAAVLAGLCLTVLPFCSGQGLVYVPPFALWLAICAVCTWRSSQPQGKRTAVLLGAFILVALVMVGLYFVDYQFNHYGTPTRDVKTILTAALAFLTLSFGESAASFWPYSAIPMLILLVASLALPLVAIWHRSGRERLRAVGMQIFLGTTVMYALVVAWGRSGLGVDYIWQYWLLPVPFLLCLFFVWGLYAPRPIGYFVQMCLFICVCVTATLNIRERVNTFVARGQAIHLVRQGVEAGEPPYLIVAKRFDNSISPSCKDFTYVEWLEKMRQAKIGFFAVMAPDPPFREVPLENLKPIELFQIKQDPQTGEYSGNDGSYLTLALPKPMHVAAVRINFADDPSNSTFGYGYFTWRVSGTADFRPDWFVWSALGSLGSPMPVVADTIDQIRIYPNTLPFHCKLVSVELLVPDPPPGGPAPAG